MRSRSKVPARTRHRNRKHRLAAGAVLASTTLLGTYMAAIRPHPTYASPKKGGAGQGQDFESFGRSPWTSSVMPSSAPTCGAAPVATNESTLRTALIAATEVAVGPARCFGLGRRPCAPPGLGSGAGPRGSGCRGMTRILDAPTPGAITSRPTHPRQNHEPQSNLCINEQSNIQIARCPMNPSIFRIHSHQGSHS